MVLHCSLGLPLHILQYEFSISKWLPIYSVLPQVQQLQYLEVDFFSKPKDRLKIADCGVLT